MANDKHTPTKRSCELAAQAWCSQLCSSTVMDVNLATAFAEILDRELAGRDELLAALKDLVENVMSGETTAEEANGYWAEAISAISKATAAIDKARGA